MADLMVVKHPHAARAYDIFKMSKTIIQAVDIAKMSSKLRDKFLPGEMLDLVEVSTHMRCESTTSSK